MTQHWITFSDSDLGLLTTALAMLRAQAPERSAAIGSLTVKLAESGSCPRITIGVYGGVVRWARGNPFPIHINDYDCDESSCPDKDEEGLPCTVGEMPADMSSSRHGQDETIT